MTVTAGVQAELKPIAEEDVARTAVFLHCHMNGKFSAQAWERGLRAGWYENAPHYGFMLEANGEVVGVICTLYSQQQIGDRTILVCNPHTWCVLEPYRSKSVSLILSVIRQPNLHYTMFSPNRDGEEIFAYLGFKPLARDALILLNVPRLTLRRNIEVRFMIDDAIHDLTAADQKCVADHREFEWLRFVFYSCNGKQGFLIYKDCKYKRLPSAQLIYISDKSLFGRCWPAIRTRLLFVHGIFTTITEQRLLAGKIPFSLPTAPASAKFFLSDTLPADAIDYTYSELVALDL